MAIAEPLAEFGAAPTWALALLVSLELGGCGVLIGPNSRFDEGSTEATTDDCSGSAPDCDSATGQDTGTDDTGTDDTGSCDGDCEFMGQALHCVEGLCLGTVEFGDLEDAHIDATKPGQMLGTQDRLHVRGGGQPTRAFIKLPQLTELPPGATVHEVSLGLICPMSQAEGTVHRVDEPWIEDEITWNDAPPVDAQVLGPFAPQVQPCTIDLTDIWEDVPNGIALYSIHDGDDDEQGSHVEIEAKESGTGPRLSMTLSW